MTFFPRQFWFAEGARYLGKKDDMCRNHYSLFTAGQVSGTQRDKRGLAPMLTVENETIGDSKSANEGCPSLVVSLGSSCQAYN